MQLTDLHDHAMNVAEEAFLLQKTNRRDAALVFYAAHLIEKVVARNIDRDSQPSYSITYCSAASLAYHAGQYEEALQMVVRGLMGDPDPPILEELEELREKILTHMKEEGENG